MKQILTLSLLSIISLTGSKILDLDNYYNEGFVHDRLYNATMEWGIYKPNQFFGIKNRDKDPVTVGLLWISPSMKKNDFDIKHTYKYESNDGEIAYYEFHDGWSASK